MAGRGDLLDVPLAPPVAVAPVTPVAPLVGSVDKCRLGIPSDAGELVAPGDATLPGDPGKPTDNDIPGEVGVS